MQLGNSDLGSRQPRTKRWICLESFDWTGDAGEVYRALRNRLVDACDELGATGPRDLQCSNFAVPKIRPRSEIQTKQEAHLMTFEMDQVERSRRADRVAGDLRAPGCGDPCARR